MGRILWGLGLARRRVAGRTTSLSSLPLLNLSLSNHHTVYTLALFRVFLGSRLGMQTLVLAGI